MKKNFRMDMQLIMLVILSTALNIAGAKAVLYFDIPVFFDSAGTILTGAVAGILPGMVVGFLTNYILSISDPITVYYCIISIMIAAAAGIMSKKGFFTKYSRALVTCGVFAVIGGIFGSMLTWIIYGFNWGDGISAPFVGMIFNTTPLGYFFSQLLADLLIDIADKFFVVTFVYFIIKCIPEKNLRGFPLGKIYTDTKEPASKGEEKNFNFKMDSLRDKIGIIIVITAIILSTTSIIVCNMLYKSVINEKYTGTAMMATRLMVNVLDGDKIDDYLSGRGQGDSYQKAESDLEWILDSVDDIKYMYVYQIREDGCYVVFDLDSDVEGENVGECIPFDEDFEERVPDLLAGKKIDPIISDGRYGYLLTNYEPIYNSDGRCVAYAAVDIDIATIDEDRRAFVSRLAALLFGISIIIVVMVLRFMDRRLIDPINRLTQASEAFSYEDEGDHDRNLEQLRNIKFNSGDEIEKLYNALLSSNENLKIYIDELHKKNEEVLRKAHTITKLQHNFIMGFADIIESRDGNTGTHIKRTAAYVRMLGDELKQMGAYPEKITPEFLDSIEQSAPLHDIGKIAVPDSILNKPGRLTEPEFELIKTHTTVGYNILHEIFADIDDDVNLSEAINMAHYHHEKWDGTGYPCGISGSDIPLCARIMALADVLDALLSKRSYKERMPLYEASAIITADSGKHFDPVVVEAFMRIKEKIKEYLDNDKPQS